MTTSYQWRFIAIAVISLFLITTFSFAQSAGNSGSINGTVQDPTGAIVPNATVEIRNPVSGYDRSTTTDASGRFNLSNIPYNPYHLTANATGFAPYVQDVDVRSSVPVNVPINLKVEGSSTIVTVESGSDLVENDSTFHTDVDKAIVDRLPLESQSSSLSSAVTLVTPGIAADSNGSFHGLGDHAENSFSVDGQPITDQHKNLSSSGCPASNFARPGDP